MAEGPRSTSTSDFGVGRRESHDASSFYARFTPPDISNDATVAERSNVSRIVCGDAREMDTLRPAVPDNSVALVVTSPPYFVGKEYEAAMGEGHVPNSYAEYLEMLHDVFAECVRKLEPGGRIAINVANLGRKPYRSLSADIMSILQDDLHLLLRGEVIWQKSKGATGSCAWGSFQSASNPVLRDLTERVVIASKGRFNRAIDKPARSKAGLPHEDTIYKDDFMDWTTDVWEIPPESATRVGHPAPFPVELPQRLIELYTYRGDFVLDPFMGSGSTAVAAVRTDRNYLGFDTDADYVAKAEQRALDAARELELEPSTEYSSEGLMAKELALGALTEAGFVDIAEKAKAATGLQMNFSAHDQQRGHHWYFDVSGAFSKGNTRTGLRRTDTLWKSLGRAAVARQADPECRVVLLTTNLPESGSAGGSALRGARGEIIFDAVDMLSPEGRDRLRRYAAGEGAAGPIGELYPPRNSSGPGS